MKSYTEIAENITTDILLNKLNDGDQIESIPQLCRKYEVSDQTVQKALKKLKAEGILFSQPGKGVFVKNKAIIDLKKTFLKIAVMDAHTPKFMNEVVNNFEKENKSIKVFWKSFNSTLPIQALISEYAPDIVIFEESNICSFMKENIWEYVDDFFTPAETYQQLLSGCFIADRPVAVPLFFSPVMVVYNKKIVQDAKVAMPAKWDMKTFISIAEKLTNKSQEDRVFGFVLTQSLYRFPALITAFGGNIQYLADSGESIKKAFDFSMDLLNRDISPLLLEGAGSDDYRFCFTEGYGAMRLETFQGLSIRKSIPFDWDIMPLPKACENGSSCFAVALCSIFKDSKNKSVAKKFLRFLFSPKIQKHIKKEYFLLPARKEICEDESIVISSPCPDNYYAFKQELQSMQSMHEFFKPNFKEIFSKEMFMFFNKIKTSKKVIDAIRNNFPRTSSE